MELLSACVLAVLVVFALLGFLALVMVGITRLFPVCAGGPDAATAAAIATVVAAVFPGARVSRIEEEP